MTTRPSDPRAAVGTSMSGEVLVLATPAVAAGFRLAGVRADSAISARDTLAALLTPASDVALLLVEEPLLHALPASERERLERRAIPVLVPFPAPAASQSDATAMVLEILRRAIGYRVRLQ